MRVLYRLVIVAGLALAGAGTASADPINVAEFRWNALQAPGCEATPDDPFCELTQFTLSNIWDGPDPGPTFFDGVLTLPTGNMSWLDLSPPGAGFDIDQIAIFADFLPTPPFDALTEVSFTFAGEVVTLGGLLTDPDTFTVLQFDPGTAAIPEPGTLALMTIGSALLARRARHRNIRRRLQH